MWSVSKRFPTADWILKKNNQCQHVFQKHNGSPQSARHKCERELALGLMDDLFPDRPEAAYRMAFLAMEMAEEFKITISISEQELE